MGLCLFLNSPSNSVQLVWLIFYKDQPFEPEIITRNKGLIYVLKLTASMAEENGFNITNSPGRGVLAYKSDWGAR